MSNGLLLAVDPGPTKSAFALLHPHDRRPVMHGKVPNAELLAAILDPVGVGMPQVRVVVIELVSHYGTGMPAGREVFDTCVWIGRFELAALLGFPGAARHLVERRWVKNHLCGSAKARDSNVTQALVDRFAPGQPNRGKGTKAQPGWFHGFAADVWQAYALGVYAADQLERKVPL